MSYLSEHRSDDFYSPSSIHFDVFITATAFRELADNMRSGVFPETIAIDLVDDESLFFTTRADPKKKVPIEFGWEPDGSGKIWHNKEKENRRIPVESIRFDFAIVKPRHDERQLDRPLPMRASTDRINDQIAPIQTSLAEMLKYSRWIATGVAALVIMIAILLVKHGSPF